MKLVRWIALGVLPLLVNTVVAGATVNLGFTSLPSAQGWTYRTSGPLESDTFAVDGTKLIENTLGTGDARMGYEIAGIVDPQQSFTIDLRARVLETEVIDDFFQASALLVYASTGTEVYAIGLSSNSIQAPFFSGQLFDIDATQFHDYRLEATPGVGSRIFVDNVLLASTAPQLTGIPNALGLGNATASEHGHAEIIAFSFLQAIPEPQTWLLMLSGCAILAARSKLASPRQHAQR
jgi:hypothetical protein